MNIAVTGATGFIGRYIVRELAAHGHSCRCWYRAKADRSGLEDVAASVDWIPGELGNHDACKSLVRSCDAVVHAALFHPAGGFMGGEGDLLPFVQKNVVGTLELIESAKASSVGRFIFV